MKFSVFWVNFEGTKAAAVKTSGVGVRLGVGVRI
jgi:hypothetical protein